VRTEDEDAASDGRRPLAFAGRVRRLNGWKALEREVGAMLKETEVAKPW
jgi:hypothetical protein